MLTFTILAEDGAARRGVVETAFGRMETPGFFAVATRAALRGVDTAAARQAGVQALICNSFHLHLEPGAPAIAAAGGLRPFMDWRDGVLATDSGGFQVFSLRHGQVADELKGRRRLPRSEAADAPAEAVRLDEQGAEFRSYLDGSRHLFTPESSVALQRGLGADVVFCLDECTPFHVSRAYTAEATERNLRWARRCRDEFERLGLHGRQAQYGIVHGGIHHDLRERSAREIAALGFEGLAIGDCLGETKRDWYRVVDVVAPLLPRERPRHLLGVGEPDDLVEGALRGIDTFDCAMPTRLARHGQALCLGRPRFRLDLAGADPWIRAGDGPIEPGCDCTTCARHARAYLAHLVRAREPLAGSLVAVHNLRFTTRLLERVRAAISDGRLAELRREVVAGAAA